MEFKIRLFQESDAVQASQLSLELGYPVDPDALIQKARELAVSGDHRIWIAERGPTIIGFLHARVVQDWIESHGLEMAALVVSESCRSQGVGQALMKEAERWGTALGLCYLFLRSNENRHRAHRFYKRLGYRPIKKSVEFKKVDWDSAV